MTQGSISLKLTTVAMSRRIFRASVCTYYNHCEICDAVRDPYQRRLKGRMILKLVRTS
jgi:hypothetical protein